MNVRATHRSNCDDVREAVQRFYEQHPYPPPPPDLESYRRRWEDEGRRRADFHLHFPRTAYRGNLQVLVAGCGTGSRPSSGSCVTITGRSPTRRPVP